MSLNCFILYHTSKLQVSDVGFTKEYDLAQLAELRDSVVKKCNELAKKVPHDEYGNVIRVDFFCHCCGHKWFGRKGITINCYTEESK